jgi:hypothetical protein
MVGEKLIKFDGKFEVELSNTKALGNTNVYEIDNTAIKYERMTANVEKVIETPMQTLIKINKTVEDVTNKNYATLSDDDYIGDLLYEVYGQDGNMLSEYNVITKYTFYYEDGTTKETTNEELEGYDGFYKYDTEEYIAIAQNDEITSITVEVHELNEYKGITRNIGEYYINLTDGTVGAENKNKIIEIDEDAPINWEIDSISISDIEGFSINIDGDYKIFTRFENPYLDDTGLEDCGVVEEENANVITYEIEISDTGAYFNLVLFKDKSVYNSYDLYTSGDTDYTPTKIKENSNYILVLNAFSDYNYNLIKDIINTIEWK